MQTRSLPLRQHSLCRLHNFGPPEPAVEARRPPTAAAEIADHAQATAQLLFAILSTI